MSLKRDEYWWIEEKDGGLIPFGRIVPKPGCLYERGCPNLQYSRKQSKELCFPGERPVKVRLVKVEE